MRIPECVRLVRILIGSWWRQTMKSLTLLVNMMSDVAHLVLTPTGLSVEVSGRSLSSSSSALRARFVYSCLL